MDLVKCNLNLTVGMHVRQLRMQHRWLQKDVARRLGVSVPTYSKLERGLIDLNFSRVIEIADILETEAIDLMVPKGEKKLKQSIHQTVLAAKDREIQTLKQKIRNLKIELKQLPAG